MSDATFKPASAKRRDSEFASGFLEAFGDGCGHRRAICDLGSPYGKLDGDVCCICGDHLLVVEREGSAPGNEWTLLKWHLAASGNYPISAKADNDKRVSPLQYKRMLVLIAFTRPANWDARGFERTVASCSMLADLLNKVNANLECPLRIVVHSHSEVVPNDGWIECGRYFGAFAKSILSQ